MALCWICGSQSRGKQNAAKQFIRKLLTGWHDVPRVIITDQLASSAAAQREILPGVEPRQHQGVHNRAEHSPQPTRQRERAMRRFTSPGQAQGFLSAFGLILDHCRPK
jgi:putative transposase